MNHTELDFHLRTLTPKELFHKINPTAKSSTLNNLPSTQYDGRLVLIFQSDNFSFHNNFAISTHPRFSNSPLHIHDYIEINYIYSGNIHQVMGDKHMHLKQGQLCIIDTNMPHSIETTTENDILINFIITKEFFTTMLMDRISSGLVASFLVNAISTSTSHDNYLLFESEDNTRLDFLMKELLCEFYANDICASENINSYMVLIFSELIRSFSYTHYTRSSSISSTIENITEILSYIEKNYRTCTLKSVADKFHFHPNYMSKFIKQTTGKSYKKIIQTQRLLQASQLLINTTVPIYEIANEIGYNNLSFFYKKFHDHFGISPQEYRKKHSFL